MEINCRGFSCHSTDKGHNIILANEPRVDLLLDEIINEKGITFVLNALGEQAIAEYLRQQGFCVTEQTVLITKG